MCFLGIILCSLYIKTQQGLSGCHQQDWRVNVSLLGVATVLSPFISPPFYTSNFHSYSPTHLISVHLYSCLIIQLVQPVKENLLWCQLFSLSTQTSFPHCSSAIWVETVASPHWRRSSFLRAKQKIPPTTSLHFCSLSEPSWPASITSTLAPVQCFNVELNIGLALCCCA